MSKFEISVKITLKYVKPMHTCSGLILRVASLLPRLTLERFEVYFLKRDVELSQSYPRDRCLVSPLTVGIFTLQLTWLIFLVSGYKENDYNK